MSNPGIGCLTYKLTKDEQKKVEDAIAEVEKLCQEYVIPGMCVVQIGQNSRKFTTTFFRNQVTAKADPNVDLLVKLVDIIWYDKADPDWIAELWGKVDEIHRQHKG